MKKLGGIKNKVLLNGCTTDSGGGGTGNSLHSCMDDLGLCVGKESYLVGFCCLHTLQLTLSNAMNETIGRGGLEERNAAQAIHSFFDLQESVEFGAWVLHFRDVATELGFASENDTIKVKK